MTQDDSDPAPELPKDDLSALGPSTGSRKRRPPMRHCDECMFGEQRLMKGGDVRLICAHNHTPPFVLPGWEKIRTNEWGWMRRCADFKRTEIADDNRSLGQKLNEEQKAVALHERRLAWRRQANHILSNTKL